MRERTRETESERDQQRWECATRGEQEEKKGKQLRGGI